MNPPSSNPFEPKKFNPILIVFRVTPSSKEALEKFELQKIFHAEQIENKNELWLYVGFPFTSLPEDGMSLNEASNLIKKLIMEYVIETEISEELKTKITQNYKDKCLKEKKEDKILINFPDSLFDLKKNKKNICLPVKNKLVSEFAQELANEIKDKNEIFLRPNESRLVKIESIKTKEGVKHLGFNNLTANQFITLIEKYLTPVVKISVNSQLEGRKYIDIKQSISSSLSISVMESDIFKKSMPVIERIYSIPIPFIRKNELIFPKKGYDERFNSWLPENCPEIKLIPLEQAKQIIDYLLRDFCFKETQDKTNAIGALLTPMLRGLYAERNCRTPIFFYEANRERAGKDYLAGITGLVYEGNANEEPPISNGEKTPQSDELRKKLTSSLRSGRVRLHFSNNKGYINNSILESFSTAKVWNDRLLGRNEEVTFSNEIELSLSGNVGISYTPDLSYRIRKIRLFYADENPNERVFENPNLHQWVLENRGLILSSLYTFIANWVKSGMPKGKTKFASFPEWAEVCGGIMVANELGDPCLNMEDICNVGGDAETRDFKRFVELCYEEHPNEWLKKEEVKNLLIKFQESENIFSWFDLNEKRDQTKFGLMLEKYGGRIFSDIKLIKDETNQRASRHRFMFSGNLGNLGNVYHSLRQSTNNENNINSIERLPTLPTLPNLIEEETILTLTELIKQKGTDNLLFIEDILKYGFSEEDIERAKQKGEVFEPRKGFLGAL